MNNKKNLLKNIKKIKDVDKQLIKLDNSIKNIDEQIELYLKNSIEIMKCNECNKDFSRKYNLIRHINDNCDYIKDFNQQKIKLNEEKNKLELEKNKLELEKIKLIEEKNKLETQKEIKKLRNTVAKLLKKNATNINITNNNKITNNNNLMVNINSFGNESLSHITINDYKRFLSGLFPGFIGFIEKVHFDENAPENHNICITNMNSKYLFTHDKGKWLSKDKTDTIDKFIAKKYNILVDKFDELEGKNELDDKIMERFNIFSRNYQDKEAQKITKNDIMLMMYNNKNKVNMK